MICLSTARVWKNLFMHVQYLKRRSFSLSTRSFGPNGFQSTGRSKDGPLAGKDWHVMDVSPRKQVHEKTHQDWNPAKIVLVSEKSRFCNEDYIVCQKHGWKTHVIAFFPVHAIGIDSLKLLPWELTCPLKINGWKVHAIGIDSLKLLPWELTCPLKINGWKMYTLLK